MIIVKRLIKMDLTNILNALRYDVNKIKNSKHDMIDYYKQIEYCDLESDYKEIISNLINELEQDNKTSDILQTYINKLEKYHE